MEKLLGAYTNYYIANRTKEHDNATIIVHGVAPHANGWSTDFIEEMETRAPNQDYYEFTWSGFSLNALVGINMIAHEVAVASMVQATNKLQSKGYKNVNIISHSWGTVVSRDAQYEGVGHINTWVTMGSPLSVFTRRPDDLDRWINIYSLDDRVATLAPWGIGETGVDAYSGPGLYNRRGGIAQVRISGGHGAYWTDETALETIGNRLRIQ